MDDERGPAGAVPDPPAHAAIDPPPDNLADEIGLLLGSASTKRGRLVVALRFLQAACYLFAGRLDKANRCITGALSALGIEAVAYRTKIDWVPETPVLPVRATNPDPDDHQGATG